MWFYSENLKPYFLCFKPVRLDHFLLGLATFSTSLLGLDYCSFENNMSTLSPECLSNLIWVKPLATQQTSVIGKSQECHQETSALPKPHRLQWISHWYIFLYQYLYCIPRIDLSNCVFLFFIAFPNSVRELKIFLLVAVLHHMNTNTSVFSLSSQRDL